ncbi:MAG: glycosyltransferase family 4 protein [Dissulfurimicrobium sp.]|uniref:glycosyltransferase family 4 protein n=1 Tax=Dissulfurimicrobium sp. TaxID=2022436 RepID=UPI004049AE97
MARFTAQEKGVSVRLAVIRRECGFGYGGAEAYCANVCEGLSSLGHDITIIADRSSVNGASFLRARVMGHGSLMKNMSFFINSRRILKAGCFDLTYGLSRVAPVNVLRISDPLHAAWLEMGYLDAGRLRRYMARHRMLLWMEKTAIKEADTIVVNSNLVKGQLERYYDVASDKIHVIYNGVDAGYFVPMSNNERKRARLALGIHEDSMVFLFAGSDFKRKGLRPLIDGLQGLSTYHDFMLLIAGADGSRDIEAYIRRLGLEKHVRWLGYATDMVRLYGIADIFILPTLYDPFANTVLEAMACGVPVLTTINNGASEVAREVADWLVIKDAAAGDINSALRRFIGLSEGMMAHLREKAVSIAARYSWKAHIDSLQTVFLRSVSCLSKQKGVGHRP